MNLFIQWFYQAPLFMVVCLLILFFTVLFIGYTFKTILWTPRCLDYGSAEWVVWNEVFRVNLHAFMLANFVWLGAMVGILWAFVTYVGIK